VTADATSHPSIHVLTYGDSGAGKTTFAATFPTPMLVCAFDPVGKDTPYLRLGVPQPVTTDPLTGLYTRSVTHPKAADFELVKLVYFHDPDFTQPRAYPAFQQFMAATDFAEWATVVVDSATFMELMARKYHQFRLNPTAKEPRQWFAGGTDLLEDMVMGRFASLLINVVITAHVDEEKDEMHGSFVRAPKFPGRMKKGVSASFGEVYRAYVARNDKGEMYYALQTRSDTLYQAASQIGAPNPCWPTYDALWTPA